MKGKDMISTVSDKKKINNNNRKCNKNYCCNIEILVNVGECEKFNLTAHGKMFKFI